MTSRSATASKEPTPSPLESIPGLKKMMEDHQKNKSKYKKVLITIFVVGILGFLFLCLLGPSLTE